MKKEVDYQADLVKCINNELDGYAFKMSNAYMSGIPDLYVHWRLNTMLIEVKLIESMPVREYDPVRPKTPFTRLQMNVLRDNLKAGGLSGIILLRPVGRSLTVFGMRATFKGTGGAATLQMPTKMEFQFGSCDKTYGGSLSWPLKRALSSIVTGSQNLSSEVERASISSDIVQLS